MTARRYISVRVTLTELETKAAGIPGPLRRGPGSLEGRARRRAWQKLEKACRKALAAEVVYDMILTPETGPRPGRPENQGGPDHEPTGSA